MLLKLSLLSSKKLNRSNHYDGLDMMLLYMYIHSQKMMKTMDNLIYGTFFMKYCDAIDPSHSSYMRQYEPFYTGLGSGSAWILI